MNGSEGAPAQTQYRVARISFTPDGTLRCEGAWTLDHLANLERQILSLPTTLSGPINCDAGAIDTMDTGGAWLLQRTVNQFERRGCSVSLNGLSADFLTLMQTVVRSWSQSEQLKPTPPSSLMARLGRMAWEHGANFRNALTFIGEATAVSSSMLAHAKRFRWRVLLANLQIDGLNAMPIIGLMSFLMGIVIAYQGSEQLKTFGANIFIVDLVGISLLREIAPLLTAILVAAGFDELVQQLREWFRLTIVIITHDLDSLWRIADRVAVLGNGRVLGIGSMSELAHSTDPLIHEYFYGPRGRAAREQAWNRR